MAWPPWSGGTFTEEDLRLFKLAKGHPKCGEQQLDIEWSSTPPLPLDTVQAIYQKVERAKKANGTD